MPSGNKSSSVASSNNRLSSISFGVEIVTRSEIGKRNDGFEASLAKACRSLVDFEIEVGSNSKVGALASDPRGQIRAMGQCHM